MHSRVWSNPRHSRDALQSRVSRLDLLCFTTTMATDPPPPQRRSRVLAELDNPSSFFKPSPAPPPFGLGAPTQTPAKTRLPTTPSIRQTAALQAAVQSNQKRKHYEYDSEDDYDYDDYHGGGYDSGPDASGSSPSRPILRAGGFGLRYDQESSVRRIDMGGHDQELRCALLCPDLRACIVTIVRL